MIWVASAAALFIVGVIAGLVLSFAIRRTVEPSDNAAPAETRIERLERRHLILEERVGLADRRLDKLQQEVGN